MKNYICYEGHCLFQFHKGAIRTEEGQRAKIVQPSFQFHKGAIRTTLAMGNEGAIGNFNSIKVRLEHP